MEDITPQQRVRAYEKNILAPYAAFSSKSRGRQYGGVEHPLRTAYQRDRDRVLHSAAFRRMEYKTQVFVNHEGDHYRTRLTHTLEVAQISRTIARTLGLNEDLAEAISLVHDLGHTPFGHSGEDILDELMSDFGGFNHNHQSLRIVDYLERRYPDFPGLNLTYEVREGIVKHETSADSIMPDIFPPDENPTLEASLVDCADTIAYNSHDIDDGLSSQILNFDELKEISIWRKSLEEFTDFSIITDSDQRRHQMVRIIVNKQVTDLITTTLKNLSDHKIESLEDVRKSKSKIVTFSDIMKAELKELKLFLSKYMYKHPHMQAMAEQAETIIRTLFKVYLNDPYKLPANFKQKIDKEPLEIIIKDFIAGMTDRYAYKMYDLYQ
ncbi:MAG: deoxyguanosinetriphosphate triphosphohydrolase [Candidatus Zixiibacteriota bacterium]